MPETPPNPPNDAPSVSVTPVTPEPTALAEVSIRRVVGSANLELQVNAKALHDLLDTLGVPCQLGIYAGRPTTRSSVATRTELSTELFLRKEYPIKVNLAEIFNTPPTFQELKVMCLSGNAAIHKILDHYQPVDIRVSIHKKIVS